MDKRLKDININKVKNHLNHFKMLKGFGSLIIGSVFSESNTNIPELL